MSRISGSRWAATEKPSRAFMPLGVRPEGELDVLAELRELDDRLGQLARARRASDRTRGTRVGRSRRRSDRGASRDRRTAAARCARARRRVPPSARGCRATVRSSVDLPAPLRPMTPSTEPFGTSNDTSRRAGTSRMSARFRLASARRPHKPVRWLVRTLYDADSSSTSIAGAWPFAGRLRHGGQTTARGGGTSKPPITRARCDHSRQAKIWPPSESDR